MDHGKKLPTTDQMLEIRWTCARPDGELSEEEKELAILYADKLVPAAAGRKMWEPLLRHKHHLSEKIKVFGKPNKTAILPSMEALIMILMENCGPKWKDQHEFKKKNGPGVEYPKEQENLWKTPYTNRKSGKKRFGGWNKRGKKRFEQLRRLIIQSRAEDQEIGYRGEKKMLELLQQSDAKNNKDTEENDSDKDENGDGASDDDDSIIGVDDDEGDAGNESANEAGS